MMRLPLLCVLALSATFSGCGGIDLSVPIGGSEGVTLFPPGSFVVRGQMTIVSCPCGDCPLFRADTGIAYHLFQNRDLDNDLYDAVTTPGAVSRLEVQRRTDLEVACEIGRIVEVQEVLELIPAPGSPPPPEQPEDES